MVTILRERIVPEFGMYRRISWYTTNRKGYRRRSLVLKKEPCAIMGRTTPYALNRRIGFAWVWPEGAPCACRTAEHLPPFRNEIQGAYNGLLQPATMVTACAR